MTSTGGPFTFKASLQISKFKSIPVQEHQVYSLDTTMGELKNIIAEKNKLQAETIVIKNHMADLVDESAKIGDLYPSFAMNPSTTAFVLIQRNPNFEGEESDHLFQSIATRAGRTQTSASSTQSESTTSSTSSSSGSPALFYGPLLAGQKMIGFGSGGSYISSYYGNNSNVKSSTGFVGLSNQGATCYMNSLIQSLFMTPEFRTAVYNWSFIQQVSQKIEKLKNPDAELHEKDEKNDKTSGKDKDKEEPLDMSWLEAANELIELWTKLELQSSDDSSNDDPQLKSESSSKKEEGQETKDSIQSSTTSGASSATSDSTTNSNVPTSKSTEEEVYESRFLSAARQVSASLHAHAVHFEAWKKKLESLSIPYQLRLLFAKLQLVDVRAESTKGLTKSFGWTYADAFTQHDVQELLRVLFDALEQAWAGTPQQSLVNDLYQGKVLDYVKCSKCNKMSAREDAYLDLQLTVKPFGETVSIQSVQEALEKYVQPEILEKDNQYFCSDCNSKQDATKGLKFASFPYLLTLQLKRFEYDWESDRRVKLNDRVSFPQVLDLNSFMDGYKKPEPTFKFESIDIPSGIRIRSATPKDAEAINTITRDAFREMSGGQLETEIVRDCTSFLSKQSCLSLIADERSILCGHVLVTPVTLSTESGESIVNQRGITPQMVGIGPLSVTLRQQDKGIGSALMRVALERCKESGVKAVFLLGHPGYYPRFGFVEASNYHISYQAAEDPKAFMVLELEQGWLSSLKLSDSNPAYLHYCEPFEAALKRHSSKSDPSNNEGGSESPNANNVVMVDLTSSSAMTSSSTESNNTLSSSISSKSSFADPVEWTSATILTKNGPNVYDLFSIFVHSGSATGGHYYAYIRDFATNKWFEFNDSTVSEISISKVESAFGDGSSFYSSIGSAYMLLYRRHDPKRNMALPSKSLISPEAREAVRIHQRRKAVKAQMKALEASKVGIWVLYRGSRKEIRLLKEQTIGQALAMAAKVFSVTVPMEDLRFQITRTFSVQNEASVTDLDTPISQFSRDTVSELVLQTRRPGTQFRVYEPRSVLYFLHVFDLATQSWSVDSYDVYLPMKPTLKQLRELVASEFGIPIPLQVLTKERSTIAPIELIQGNDDLVLSLPPFSLWEKSVIWVEPLTEDIIDKNYVPQRRKKLYSPTLAQLQKQQQEANILTPTIVSPASNGSDKAGSCVTSAPLTTSSEEFMDIKPLGDDEVSADNADSSNKANETVSAITGTGPDHTSNQDDSSSGNSNDDQYEYVHNPKHFIINNHRILPRAEDVVRNQQNRLIVRYTTIGGTSMNQLLLASKTDTVGELRKRLAKLFQVDEFSFIIKRGPTMLLELNDSDDELGLFTLTSTLPIGLEKGTPCVNGESKLEVEFYNLPKGTEDPALTVQNAPDTGNGDLHSNNNHNDVAIPTYSGNFSLFWPIDKMTVLEAKKKLCRLSQLKDVPITHLRIRKYGYGGYAAAIGMDTSSLGSCGNRIYIQVLSTPEPKLRKEDKVIILRQVFPEKWEFGPAIEFPSKKDMTYMDIVKHCEKIAGCRVDCCSRPLYNLPAIFETDSIDWAFMNSRLERELSSYIEDGDFFYFKDASASFKPLSDAEKKALVAKHKARHTTSSSSSSSYFSRYEKALTIKVEE